MKDTELYAQILGISAPFYVARVELQVAKGSVSIWVEHGDGERFDCPECGTSCSVYDHAEAVLRQPDVDDVLGLRDRAMMEVLYSTGIRRCELVKLKVFDVDAHRGTLMIREGKGKPDPVVPLGERALAWIQKYMDASRLGLHQHVWTWVS